jgi:hypothetical protein
MNDGVRIQVREAVEPYAAIVVSGLEPQRPDHIDRSSWPAAAKNVKLAIYGPKCAYARTLPTTFSPTHRGPGQAEFLVQDPCYWTPALPFLYELIVEGSQLAAAAGATVLQGKAGEARIGFGLRRLASRRNSLYLEGKRFVPRGVNCDAVTPAALEQAHDAEVALIARTPPLDVLRQANQRGVLIIADQRGHPLDQAPWLGDAAPLFPSVIMTIFDARQMRELERIEAAGDSLIAIAVGSNDAPPEATPAMRRCAIAVELAAGERPPGWVANCGRPVIAIRRGGAYADFQAARAACDRLQADLAPQLDLAGYFV